jgi:Ca-activated chloride channel homolog
VLPIEFISPSIPTLAKTFFLIAFVFLFLFATVRSRGDRLKFIITGLLRLCVLFLLALVFAGPYLADENFVGTVPALIDVSDSLEEADGEALLAELKKLAESDLNLAIYPFARSVSKVAIGVNDFTSYKELRKAFSGLGTEMSDLEAALNETISVLKPKQLLLASDGYETRGDVRANLSSINQVGAAIFPIVPPDARDLSGRFRIARIHAPLTAPQLSTVPIRVTVENTTTSIQTGEVDIIQGDRTLLHQTVKLGSFKEQVLVAQSLPAEGGIQAITARLTIKGDKTRLSEKKAFISSEGREKVLLLSGSSDDARYLGQVLQNQAYQLDNRVGGLSLSADAFNLYTTIILNNISLDQLGRSQAEKIVQAVRSGKGLIMVGGERSFGLGGYRGSVIEEALPVELVPPQQEEKRLNVAVMLVIDKSRSMDSEQKMDFAKEAARTFIASLRDEDYVGVIAFDAAPFIVVRLGLLSEIRQMAIDRIGRIFPTGATQPLTAIDEARRALMRVNAGRKHMLFLTDGQIENAGPQYTELVRQMRLLGMTSSMVMLGPELDGGFLRSLANTGGGIYYQTTDARSLPRIFLNDVKVASGQRAMKEERSYTVTALNPNKPIVTLSDYPDLRGFVETKLKSGAVLDLQVQASDVRAPLLAHRPYGAGNVVAFTSDANARWSRDWVGWQGFHAFWNQLLTGVQPEQVDSGGEKLPADLRYFVEGGQLVLEYAIYAEGLAGDLTAQVTAADGKSTQLGFELVSPGRYRALISEPKAGRYDVVAALGNKKTSPVAFELDALQFAELKEQGFNLSLLDSLARLTGAIRNPAAESFKYGLNKEVTRKDLSPWLIGLAIFLMLAEILLREVFRFKVKTKSFVKVGRAQLASR